MCGPPVMDIPNPLKPDRMSAKERLSEVTRILALGLIRLCARQSTQLSGNEESPLHIPRPVCGCLEGGW